ncbi:NAD(P)-dependent oxidoreductase [Coxiella-like endosymbiont of Rhipicephalus sanguineus]|uniref:NAD(P)-dependent oxidoreductase n=1 Tax=Coxiella-like endosymbiont of Rhipicephalus sanguineus TaxID=1955402 RepID=UPI00203A98A3|nr:NAD(P)-dependent oxidoreductase [Coxiella-like endosymbiont of Rhipicephalus sanguineus]
MDCDDKVITHKVNKNKKRFPGFEFPGKTMGIIGLDKIDVQVANTAIRLGMNAVGYDPVITVRNAWELSTNVIQAESM